MCDSVGPDRENILAIHATGEVYGARTVFSTLPFVWSNTMAQDRRDQIHAGFIGAEVKNPKTEWYTPTALEKGLSSYNTNGHNK